MSGEYRDELAAAHARIAELQDEIRALREARRGAHVADGRFPELEAEVERLRRAADPQTLLRRHTTLASFGAAFPLLGLVFTFLNMPIFAVLSGTLFVLAALSSLSLGRLNKVRTLDLERAVAKLQDAQRIADLEAEVANTRVRVASEAHDALLVDEVESGGEAGVRRRA